jgi:hypothetical protein
VAGAVACLAAAALALGLAGDALAINSPPHLRKVSKNVAAIKPLPTGKGRSAALSKGATPGNGAPSSNTGRTDPARSAAVANRSASTGPLGAHRDFLRLSAPERLRLRAEHRNAILAVHARLPQRPLPGERGFTGVPPAGENPSYRMRWCCRSEPTSRVRLSTASLAGWDFPPSPRKPSVSPAAP